MNNNQSENKEPDFFTPNAPITYATAGGRGVMIGYNSLICHRRNCRVVCWAMVGVAFFCLSYHSS